MNGILTKFVGEKLYNIQTSPKRLIDGGVDPISGKHMAEFYKEIVPDADVVILETIGHYPNIEALEKVSHHYNEFRKRL